MRIARIFQTGESREPLDGISRMLCRQKTVGDLACERDGREAHGARSRGVLWRNLKRYTPALYPEHPAVCEVASVRFSNAGLPHGGLGAQWDKEKLLATAHNGNAAFVFAFDD